MIPEIKRFAAKKVSLPSPQKGDPVNSGVLFYHSTYSDEMRRIRLNEINGNASLIFKNAGEF